MKPMQFSLTLIIPMLLLGCTSSPKMEKNYSERLVAHPVGQKIPKDPQSEVWQKHTPYRIDLKAQKVAKPKGGGSVTFATVRALYNDQKIAFLVEWKDKTKDTDVSVDQFKDSVALQFPVKRKSNASPLMGTPSHPVNIWQWRSDWQARSKEGKAITPDQPQTEGVFATPPDKHLKSKFPARPHENANGGEYIAEGWGTLTLQNEQNIETLGKHYDNFWSVILMRKWKREDPNDARFEKGKKHRLNIAIWNGSQKDVNGKKSVSMRWIPFQILKEGAKNGKNIANNGK